MAAAIRGKSEKNKNNLTTLAKIKIALIGLKFVIAVLIDLADFFISNIPLVSIVWDGLTIIALYFLLNDKRFCLLGLVEFLVPLFRLKEAPRALGAYVPTATVIVLADIIKERKWLERK